MNRFACAVTAGLTFACAGSKADRRHGAVQELKKRADADPKYSPQTWSLVKQSTGCNLSWVQLHDALVSPQHGLESRCQMLA